MCNNNRYGSNNSKNLRSSYIVGYWCKDGGEIAKNNEYEMTPYSGITLYFLKHSSIFHNWCFEHWFAYCEWFHPVNTDIRYRFDKPVEVWYRNFFKQFGPASYIPVQQSLLLKFVHAPYELRSKDLAVIVPRFTVSLWIYLKEILHEVYMLKMNLTKCQYYRKHWVFDALLNII